MSNVAQQINQAPSNNIEAATVLLNELVAESVDTFKLKERQVLQVFACNGICRSIIEEKLSEYRLQGADFDVETVNLRLFDLIVSRLRDTQS